MGENICSFGDAFSRFWRLLKLLAETREIVQHDWRLETVAEDILTCGESVHLF